MISKDIYVEDLVQTFPQVVVPLAEKGIICVRCGEPVWGTLAELAESKNIKDLDEIIDQINQLISK
ncbi:MAG: DUF1858 domain-containing protein [Fidelibacterota bacterium]